MLVSAIRTDAQVGCPVGVLAARHRVRPRAVRRALTAVTPQRRQVVARYKRVLDHTREHIDALLEQGLTARQIWCRLLDDHDIAISFASVSSYIARQRKTAAT
ncbi:hypothetical protein [Kitasatospora sp. LaBMicrA B282]|uniref:hypothetical protein n=1 Tax=Kitasatospora sp. LaBMicrA B282 TaxID=3420949 RepID=UPI003D096890